ncbi:Flp family type IVb pilin [Comamonas sp. BIGb0124]|uniref:Flp family type IVb pilin n=1 Tax=Comamonas sp. BIGb0124 TaxID=2485130 RepID=UPI000F468AB3|nr:Flp family type IVb pilin [Comamonas sp. BIGb0124]
MKNAVIRFLKDEEGATAIEYGLIAGLIAVAIAGALTALSGQLTGLFGRISGALQGATITPTTTQ